MAEENRQFFDLFGTYHHKMDEKGRVALPACFRKSFPEELKEFLVTLSETGECLYVFDRVGFNQWVKQAFDDKFGGFNSSDPQHRRLQRCLTGRAASIPLDSAGRLTIPADKREAAGIGKDVVILGTTGRFEIWDESRYSDDVDLSILFG